MLTVDDFEEYAKRHIPSKLYNHVSSGADGQHTLNDNCTAFKRYRLRPRVLRDVSKRDLSTVILGREFPCPIGIAPTSVQKMACSDGEVAMAKAAASVGTPMILSTYSSSSIEEVAMGASNAHLWFQLYILKDRSHTKDLIRRAENAGFEAIAVTVDTPYAGWKLNDERCGGFYPDVRLALASGDYSSDGISSSVTMADIQWVCQQTTLPVIIKGIVSGDTARECVNCGISGLIVSNHGGRQLDGVPATIDLLPEIVVATRGSGLELYFDGGIRCGTDVFKALALGARAVFIGRPAWWGLVYKGEEGARQVLQILRDELSLAMALTGCTSLSDISPSMVVLGEEAKL